MTVIDAADQILPNLFDPEMAELARRRLRQAGIRVLTNTPLSAVTGTERADGVMAGGSRISADLVVLAIGVRPATAFLADSGLTMVKGAIVVDERMRTNIPDVYAAGDCVIVANRQTHQPQVSAMGSTANITGRSLACTLTGTPTTYEGCFGTGVVRLLEGLNAGRTGLTEAQARTAGYDPETVVCAGDDKAHYYPGSSFFITKLVADRVSHKLLGIQVLGSAVDKMVDVAVTGLAAGMTLEAFNDLDYAYAPPFSTAIHPFVQACLVLENKLSRCDDVDDPGRICRPAQPQTIRYWMCCRSRPFQARSGSIWPSLTVRLKALSATRNCYWSAIADAGLMSCRTVCSITAIHRRRYWKAE